MRIDTGKLYVLASAISALCLAPPIALAGVIEKVAIPPSRQQGLDMIVVDEDALPPEPELAADAAAAQVETFGAAPLDPAAPVHPLYTKLSRQLEQYRTQWGKLPQVLVGGQGAIGPKDARLPLLRERFGLSRAGGIDKSLVAKLTAFQKSHGLVANGKAGPETLAALDRGAAYYERVILLNMERARRLPVASPGKSLLVDAGAARLWMYQDGLPVDSMKAVVGAPATETPMLAAMIRYMSVNPYWNVPPELVVKLIAPKVLAQGLTYLSERRYQVLDGWGDDAGPIDPAGVDWAAAAQGELQLRVRQLPGGGNSMGAVKFMMPNTYGIYLHDTPNKPLFEADERWVSNGCIRVEDARRLAVWLHGELPGGTSPDIEDRVDLVRPVPVYVTYFTVDTEAKAPSFRPDRYGRDAKLLARFPTSTKPPVDRDKQFRDLMTLGG